MSFKFFARHFSVFLTIILAVSFFLFIFLSSPVNAASPQVVVYDESLNAEWQNWSWKGNVDLNYGEGFTGSKSIRQETWNPWGGLYFHSEKAVDSSVFSTLNFSAKPVTSGSVYKIALVDGNNKQFKEFVPLSDFGALETGKWKKYSIKLSDLGTGGKVVKGIIIHETSGFWTHTLQVDDISFSSAEASQQPSPSPSPSLAPSLSPSPSALTSPSPSPSSSPVPSLTPSPSPSPSIQPAPVLRGYTANGGKIYKNGSPIKLKGVNWFGAETGTFVPHGLWARNYKEIISQMKSLGFNAVRIPVCPRTLYAVPVNSVDYSKNPKLAGRNSLDVLHNIVGELNSQQMFALLDHHRPNCDNQTDLWYTDYYSETQWINDLKTIADQFKYAEYFIGIDIKNEPYGRATWGTGNAATDWNKAAERAGQAVLSVNPNLLIFVQGVGENPVCSSNVYHFWGQNLEPQKCTPISESAIPAGKLVFSPHIYGPDVNRQYYFDDPSFPANMPQVWDTQFGFLAGNYTLVPGEWGGKYGTAGGDPKDKKLQDALVNYFKTKGMCSSFYWSWNPNSTDTGGILQDDWKTPWPEKVNLVGDLFRSCN
jgi:endoglucanase